MVHTATPPAFRTANQHAASIGVFGARSRTLFPGTTPRSSTSTCANVLAVSINCRYVHVPPGNRNTSFSPLPESTARSRSSAAALRRSGYASSGIPVQSRTGQSWRGGKRSAQNVSTCPVATAVLPIRRFLLRVPVEHLAGDHELLHLRCPLVYPQRANLPVQLLHRMTGDDAASAEQLESVVYHALSRLGCEHLRHCRLSRDARGSVVPRPCGAIDQQRTRVNRSCHLRDACLRELKIPERLTEEPSAGDVSERFVQRASRETQGRCANCRPEHIQRSQRNLEALPRLPNHTIGGNSAILESNPGERMRRERLYSLGDRKSGISRSDNERDELRPGIRSFPRSFLNLRIFRLPSRRRCLLLLEAPEDHIEIRDAAVRDPGLLAIDDVIVSVEAGCGLHRRNVGACFRFRDGKCRNGFTRSNTAEVPLLQRIRSEQRDRARAEPLHRERDVRESGDARESLTGNAE